MAGKRNDYYDTFVKLVDYSCQASTYLHESLQNFDPKMLKERMKNIHHIEHDADEDKHAMMKKLAKEFITPIEREDIIQLAQEIDEVTDTVEDVLIRVYMYNVSEVRPEALKLTEVIVKCCKALKLAMEEFHNFKKSETIQQSIIEVNRLEEEGDNLYIEAVRNLYSTSQNHVEIMGWSKVFDRLENCCDACEHVANVVEGVVMKNS